MESSSMSAIKLLQHLSIVLVEPRSPGNIGMVCRAMANFGVRDLRLVNPFARLDEEARRLAVFADGLLESARFYPDLAAAVGDLHLSVATTRRAGRYRGELHPLTDLPEHLGALPRAARIGLVFGREDSGLTTGELALCTMAATIPTVAESASLNLAQAVILCLYELSRAPLPAHPSHRELPQQSETEEFFHLMATVLDRIAFLNRDRPESVLHPLRRLHSRAAPDRRELGLLRGVWEQINSSIQDWEGRRRGRNDGPKTG